MSMVTGTAGSRPTAGAGVDHDADAAVAGGKRLGNAEKEYLEIFEKGPEAYGGSEAQYRAALKKAEITYQRAQTNEAAIMTMLRNKFQMMREMIQNMRIG